MANIRTRFAPSPTGYLHVGGARTALFSWLFARKNNGEFILRIEDTDTERNSEEMVKGILDGMEWLGLNWDEGPFYQSENKQRHIEAAHRLVKDRKAYYDFTPKKERSDENIKEQIEANARVKHDNRGNPYRDMSIFIAKDKIAAGEPYCIRLKTPKVLGLDPEHGSKEVVFYDLVFDKQHRALADIEDLVLVRQDGNPLYNLSVVCDDIDMRITHVIRGSDHLTNTFKQILIYRALGASVPTFAHLPLITAPGKKKLSKRIHGPVVSVTNYRDKGFIPIGLINYLALLGWAPKNNKEIMSMEELIQEFDLDRINKAPAMINFTENNPNNWTDKKAIFINAEHMRSMCIDELSDLVKERLKGVHLSNRFKEAGFGSWEKPDGINWILFTKAVGILRKRFHTLEDFTTKGLAYFCDEFPIDFAAKAKLLSNWKLLQALPLVAAELMSGGNPEQLIRQTADWHEVKQNDLIGSVRAALTGQNSGPHIEEIIDLIGLNQTRIRLLSIEEKINAKASTASA